jgi:hypothetical protein
MSKNPYSRFWRLSAKKEFYFAQVTTVGSGSSTVTDFYGNTFLVKGDSSAIGAYVFIENGIIINEAPTLTPTAAVQWT